MSEEDRKQKEEACNSPPDEKKIRVRTRNQNGAEVLFAVNKTTCLRKLMDRYCDQLKINREKVRFLYNGTRLKAENHIGEYEMEDGAIIDVMCQQTGGLTRSLFY